MFLFPAEEDTEETECKWHLKAKFQHLQGEPQQEQQRYTAYRVGCRDGGGMQKAIIARAMIIAMTILVRSKPPSSDSAQQNFPICSTLLPQVFL
ncbi:hypothetical protein SLEP1_g58642 [Rubroshorea leprosula]|uniref:Uncharacterized protein n=1 Tax=Rubroshorea leprosula TaxID=152421 RepID=A0AAV5MR46_9ROSI|nr:hypothetical protein SLEP1_g58642 [Rubroshorea leprosula]